VDNFLRVKYLNSDMIEDFNGEVLKLDTYGTVWL